MKFNKIIALILIFVLSPTLAACSALTETSGNGAKAPAASDPNIPQSLIELAEQLIPQHGPNGKFLMPINSPEAGSIAISTRAELEAIRNNLGAMYHLTADIDLSGAEWVPIDNFRGIFDGQGHIIRNMTITMGSYEYNGLFGSSVEGGENVDIVYSVKNVGMEDTNIDVTRGNSFKFNSASISGGGQNVINCYNTGTISASEYDEQHVNASAMTAAGISVGGTSSYCYNTATIIAVSTPHGSNAYAVGINGGYGYVDNCFNSGSVTASAISSTYAGGITIRGDVHNSYNIGTVSASSRSFTSAGGIAIGSSTTRITNCFNTGEVSALSPDSRGQAAQAAGIICMSQGDYSIVNNCYNTGAVFSSGNAGGIGVSVTTISNCYNTGDISAVTTDRAIIYAGGINGSGSTINNCYNIGDVSAVAADRAYAGGINGSGGTINNCYNIGNVSADSPNNYIGGIVSETHGSVINSYSLNNYGSRIGVQLTSDEMKKAANFSEWDFDNVWAISSSVNSGYPHLIDVPHR